MATNATTAVVRASALYGENLCRAKKSDNFVRLMLRLGAERGSVKVVTDEFVSPTCKLDVARQIIGIVEAGATGVFHVTSQGETSWNDSEKAIFEETASNARVEPASCDDCPSKVRRSAYSVLDNGALRTIKLDQMPPRRDALRRCIKAIGAAP